MKISNATKEKALLIGGGAIAVYLLARQLGGAVGEAAQSVGAAVNPVSDENIFYRAANSVTGVLTGGKDFSFGGWLYDVTHRDETINANLTAADVNKPAPARSDTVDYFDFATLPEKRPVPVAAPTSWIDRIFPRIN